MQLLALASLFMAAGAPATCLLQRDLNFRALGLIQFASYAAGYLAVGIPMALHGYGAYALGAACVVQSAVDAGRRLCGQAPSGAPAVLATRAASTRCPPAAPFSSPTW